MAKDDYMLSYSADRFFFQLRLGRVGAESVMAKDDYMLSYSADRFFFQK
jgi:hypothetical protein